jgi:type IV pilus assembly protein PilN
MKLEIAGTARSFDDVNYFLLTLQRSSFFKSNETQLVSAQLVTNPTKLEVPETKGQSVAQVTYQLPKLVEYKIQTSLNDAPASELLRELDRKGAVGVVTRIRTLQQIQEKGGTQP